MANYYGTTRTNYFAVKDANAFKDFLKAAANLATGLCADAWGREDDEDIICIGVIEGNLTVALWDDENHCGG